MKTIVAVPSEAPGGLEAPLSPHFGNCPMYTLVEIDESGQIVKTMRLANDGHAGGDCLVPVDALAKKGVTALISGGMGGRPLAGFKARGIKVYLGRNLADVAAAVKALAQGELPIFEPSAVCGGCR